MQRTSQNERVKSVNLLAHLAPDRRRNKTNNQSLLSTVSEDSQQKMVHEPKKIETGILVGEYVDVLPLHSKINNFYYNILQLHWL